MISPSPTSAVRRKAYCKSRGWEIAAEFVEPGQSATDDRRPEFQRMIDAATTKPPTFDMIVVHSYSRFFRDQFQLSFMSAGSPRTACGSSRSPRSSATIR